MFLACGSECAWLAPQVAPQVTPKDLEYYAEDGTPTPGKLRLIDFERPASDDWLAVNAAASEAGLIKPDETVDKSRKFARYVPFWA